MTLKFEGRLDSISHSFTKYKVRLDPVIFTSVSDGVTEDCEWMSQTALKKVAFSSGHRRLYQSLLISASFKYL